MIREDGRERGRQEEDDIIRGEGGGDRKNISPSLSLTRVIYSDRPMREVRWKN
jgi:hypothetical protein